MESSHFLNYSGECFRGVPVWIFGAWGVSDSVGLIGAAGCGLDHQ